MRVLPRGTGDCRTSVNRASKPLEPPSPVVSQCQGEEPIGVRLAERAKGFVLILKHAEHELRVELRIVELRALPPAVLIVLDEVMVRVAGGGQRIQSERVHEWKLADSQARNCRLKVLGVEPY